jgi:hypothetical protein
VTSSEVLTSEPPPDPASRQPMAANRSDSSHQRLSRHTAALHKCNAAPENSRVLICAPANPLILTASSIKNRYNHVNRDGDLINPNDIPSSAEAEILLTRVLHKAGKSWCCGLGDPVEACVGELLEIF